MPIIEFIVSMTQFSRRSKCSIGRHEFTRRSLGGDTEAPQKSLANVTDLFLAHGQEVSTDSMFLDFAVVSS